MAESANEHFNYFNYFTEVEEHFQRARGTGLYLLSPLDWALIEAWKNAGVPIEAVLRGIDAAMENWRSRKQRFQNVNSIAYCTQAVMAEAQAAADAGSGKAHREVEAPFTLEELKAHLTSAAAKLRGREEFAGIVVSLDRLTEDAETEYGDLEQLEQRLSALEEKMAATVRAHLSEDELFAMRRELDLSLKPYRGKMSAEQISMLERQYLERRLMEASGLPRLSLFYLA